LVADLKLVWRSQLSDYITAIVWCGATLAIATADGAVELRRSDGTIAQTLRSPDGQSISTIGHSADRQYFAAAGQAGTVWIWRLNAVPELVATLNYPHQWIEHLAWHPVDSTLVFSVGSNVVVYDVATNRPITTLAFQQSSVLAIHWQPQGEWLAIGGYQAVKIWSTQDWAADPEILMVDAASVALQWSPDGRFLASGNLERSITVVDWATRAVPWQMRGFPGKVRQVAWSPPNSAGNSLLASSSAEGVVLWVKSADADVGWDGQVLGRYSQPVTDLAWHPQQPLVLASVSQDGQGSLFWPIGQPPQPLPEIAAGFSCLAWHPDGRWLAAGGAAGETIVWAVSE
jgi:WD40 repeat protein